MHDNPLLALTDLPDYASVAAEHVEPATLTFREVETLFHELGHALQHMLTTVDYGHASGIEGVEWDAVELPSQFMENWAYHRETLRGLSRHVKTGEALPDALFHKVRAAKSYNAGLQLVRQLQFGLADLALHHRGADAGANSPHAVFADIARRLSPLPVPPGERFLCSFGHIFAGSYAAGYYSYKWAEVLSADAFGAFEEAGLDDAAALTELGRRFRDTVLARGGSEHPAEVFRAFRGRDPTPEALLRDAGLLEA